MGNEEKYHDIVNTLSLASSAKKETIKFSYMYVHEGVYGLSLVVWSQLGYAYGKLSQLSKLRASLMSQTKKVTGDH